MILSSNHSLKQTQIILDCFLWHVFSKDYNYFLSVTSMIFADKQIYHIHVNKMHGPYLEYLYQPFFARSLSIFQCCQKKIALLFPSLLILTSLRFITQKIALYLISTKLFKHAFSLDNHILNHILVNFKKVHEPGRFWPNCLNMHVFFLKKS